MWACFDASKHSCVIIFEELWLDLVVVTTTDKSTVWDLVPVCRFTGPLYAADENQQCNLYVRHDFVVFISLH
jgi:hypothetical protein